MMVMYDDASVNKNKRVAAYNKHVWRAGITPFRYSPDLARSETRVTCHPGEKYGN
jgi:hypothetical protein